jgi:cytochrome P450
MTAMTSRPIPPGSMGLPLLGETLSFIRNPFRFLELRRDRHGDVFKSQVLGRRIVFLAGIRGAEAFYDTANISRRNAQFYQLADMFGGTNMASYDGPKHLALKTIALGAFDRAAIAGYLPGMEQLIEVTLARLAAREEFSAMAELRRFAIEAISRSTIGDTDAATAVAITRDYGYVLAGLVTLPLALPGTPYGRARAARDRLLALMRRTVAERRASPRDDALSRLLAGRAADGTAFTDEEAALEVHHFMLAGFVVYRLVAEIFEQLGLRPELRAQCLEEIRAHAASGPLTMESLAKLSFCTHVVLEAKRWLPLVPFAMGRARRTFPCGGYDVPEGWTVYLALTLNNKDRAIYRDPERFDPDRFGPERAEHKAHPMAFIPQGAEPPTGHRCLGLDYSTILSLTFLTLLVRGYAWELPPQNLETDWKALPPVPKDGLRVRLRARAG